MALLVHALELCEQAYVKVYIAKGIVAPWGELSFQTEEAGRALTRACEIAEKMLVQEKQGS